MPEKSFDTASTRVVRDQRRRQAAIILMLAAAVAGVFPFGLAAEEFTFSTFVGSAGGAGWFDGPGTSARFGSPGAVAVGPDDAVYVADSLNHTIRRIAANGQVTTLAGLAGQPGALDGRGSAARFDGPRGVAVGDDGVVYVADTGNHLVRRISPSGDVTTLAGLAGVFGSADGSGSFARFADPVGIGVDDLGFIYVTDRYSHVVRKISPGGDVMTHAGAAWASGSIDGAGSAARFRNPSGLAVDATGNVYVADQNNNTIRVISVSGVVSTLAGQAGSSGSIDGIGSAARFSGPTGVTIDSSSGVVFVADTNNNLIRAIDSSGVVTTVAGALAAGSEDGAGGDARFFYPTGIAVGIDGNMFVGDSGNHTVRMITSTFVVTTCAGVAQGRGTRDGTGTDARFRYPSGVAIDGDDNVYVADTFSHTIRKVAPNGEVTTLAGMGDSEGSADGTGSAARFRLPLDVAVTPEGFVYVADSRNRTIRRISPDGVVTTIAGLAGVPGCVDGVGSAARFAQPAGVAVDESGIVYVADELCHLIRRISPEGVVTTLAGSPWSEDLLDGTGSAARFWEPRDVHLDAAGNIYVADGMNHAIRRITSGGEVTTLARVPSKPYQIAIDEDANLLVAGGFLDVIWTIGTDGTVDTLAGYNYLVGNVDGVGTSARFNYPQGVAFDSNGWLFVSDTYNHAIRVGKPSLSGSATVDDPSGYVGATHQLDFTGSGTSFSWSVVRRPSGSLSLLSDAGAESPTFVPDVLDGYEFQLIAWDGSSSRIERISLEPARIVAASTTVPEGVGEAVVTLTLTQAKAHPVVVDWSTDGGTAVAGDDFVAASGTATFDPGETSQSVTVTILDDGGVEDTESFFVRLSGIEGADTGSDAVVIIEDDDVPTLSVEDAAFEEGSSGLWTAAVTATLSEATQKSVSASFALANGTAEAGSDYSWTSGSLHFEPGETSTTIEVKITGDVIPEADETFFINLSDAVNASIADAEVVVTIVDDDFDTGKAVTGLSASAASAASVALSWSAFGGATGYRVSRSGDGTTFAVVGSPSSTTFLDTTAGAGKAYLYKVRATDGVVDSMESSPDLATTVLFTEPDLVAGVTTAKAAHVTELRTAVNAVRQLARLAAATFTDSNLTTIKRTHVVELRAALDAARSALGLPAIAYTDPAITAGVTRIKAAHVQELRDGVR